MSRLYNLDIEQAVLATLMYFDNAYQKTEGKLSADIFHSERHQEIYKIIEQLAESGQPYDAIMVIDQIIGQKKQEITGGEEYLSDLGLKAPASQFNLSSYIDRLVDLSQRRKISSCYEEAKGIIANFDVNPSDAWSVTAESVNAAMLGAQSESYSTLGQLMDGFIEDLSYNFKNGVPPNIKTGLMALDNKVMISKGDLVIVAARPSMGKTTLAQNILRNIAENEEGVTVFFSLEMPKLGIVRRLVSSMASVDMGKIFSGQNLDTPDWQNIFINTQRIEALPMIIDDRSGITVGDMRATLNRIRQQHGKVSAVMVDYLQLVRHPMGHKINKTQQVEDISAGLKGIAKEFDCPMIALSQLNRGLENRPNKRPVMADLRDSGAIEQDADHIIFIYRDEVYNEKSEDAGLAELIVGKQRNGQVGTVKVKFEGGYSRFVDWVPGYADELDQIPNYGSAS